MFNGGGGGGGGGIEGGFIDEDEAFSGSVYARNYVPSQPKSLVINVAKL
jgi:hypothetical protein